MSVVQLSVDSNIEHRFLASLEEKGRLTSVATERLRRVQWETGDRLASVILKIGAMSEAELAEEMAAFTGIDSISDDGFSEQVVPIEVVSNAFLRIHEIIPINLEDQTLRIACWDVLDDYPARALEFATGLTIQRYVATRKQVLAVLERFEPTPELQSDATSASVRFEDEEIDRLKDLASEAPVIRLVQRVINAAVAMRASDIHLESSEAALHIRFRADGLLREIETQPKELAASVISRIKVMAGLNIAERRLPQDGRIRVAVQGKDIDFRVATSPTLHGESIVLRILDRQDVALDFDALGFDDGLKTTLRSAIARPYGIILVTGPTGSGKTTTLYAALKEINTPDKKILTVEDPVEYVLQGINQVPIKPQIGLTFANALRAFLRQDPDVMMVGEIRDRETAEIAIQAALTGHLLFSTLHTNTAAAAMTRLLDMGIDDYLLTSTLHVVLGQRLVRKLCVQCRQPYEPSPAVCARFGIKSSMAGMWYRASGCAACHETGYRGRTTLIEALVTCEEIRGKVLAKADAHAIEQVAVENGMRTMFQHGLERVHSGMTSIEEVLRATSLN